MQAFERDVSCLRERGFWLDWLRLGPKIVTTPWIIHDQIDESRQDSFNYSARSLQLSSRIGRLPHSEARLGHQQSALKTVWNETGNYLGPRVKPFVPIDQLKSNLLIRSLGRVYCITGSFFKQQKRIIYDTQRRSWHENERASELAQRIPAEQSQPAREHVHPLLAFRNCPALAGSLSSSRQSQSSTFFWREIETIT